MASRLPLPIPRALGPVCRFALFVALGCGPPGSAGARRGEARPNVLFVTVDTLRADHLTPYGYERSTSPALAALAQGGVVFEQAQASSSWTLPTLASVVTGQYTSTHGCWKRRSRLSPDFETLPEWLRDAGYDTACVISHVFLARAYGLQQGFVHFDPTFDRPVAHGDQAVSSPRVTREGVAWIENQAAAGAPRPWFLWLHYFDPHYRYVAHPGPSAAFGHEAPADRYDGEILFTDQHIGRVLAALERTGLDETTIVVFFADHGEEFEDHGGLYHGHSLHGELVRVPLVLRAPGIQAGRVTHPVRTVDLMPTVLELVGLDVPPGLAGESLVPSLRGEAQALPALAELRLEGEEHHFDAVVDGDWKLIVAGADSSARLYRLSEDAGETRDVAHEFPEQVRRLRGLLTDLVERARRAGEAYAPVSELDLSGSEAEQLEGLGYAGSDEDEEREGRNGMDEDGGQR